MRSIFRLESGGSETGHQWPFRRLIHRVRANVSAHGGRGEGREVALSRYLDIQILDWRRPDSDESPAPLPPPCPAQPLRVFLRPATQCPANEGARCSPLGVHTRWI